MRTPILAAILPYFSPASRKPIRPHTERLIEQKEHHHERLEFWLRCSCRPPRMPRMRALSAAAKADALRNVVRHSTH